MGKQKNIFLLTKYFNLGWLERRYFDGQLYHQPYSAYDRLHAGRILYDDFIGWKKGVRLVRDYDAEPVDVALPLSGNVCLSAQAERFRQALKNVPKASLSVLYRIVLNEEEIKPPVGFSEREKLYFNDEIKGLLCRGLDQLCSFYGRG